AGRPAAAEAIVEPPALGLVGGARRELHEADAGAELVEGAEHLLECARLPLDRRPVERGRVHEHRVMEALGRIFELALVDVLPAGLVAVLLLPARAGIGIVDAAFELAGLAELARGVGDLLLRHVAVAAGAGELQHESREIALVALGAVARPFGEIADGARGHDAVAVEAGLALELEAELIEIVPVARREEIAAGVDERELKIVDRAVLALEQAALDEAALTVAVLALGDGNLFGVDDLHGVPPARTRRCAARKPYRTIEKFEIGGRPCQGSARCAPRMARPPKHDRREQPMRSAA